MDVDKLDRRILRFLVTIFKYMPKQAKPAFIQTSSKIFDVNSSQLLYRLNSEIQANGGAKKATFPQCVIMDLKPKSEEVMIERKKLQVIRELVMDGEDIEYIFHLVDEPVITYCRSCKKLEYERSFYMSHNMINPQGHVCSSIYYLD